MALDKSVYPPGYRFVPTDVELVTYYLARQTAGLSSPSSPILEVQIYNYSPDEIFKNYNLSEDDVWYFFSSRMKRYDQGSRPDRTAGAGFWKATGAKTGIYDKNKIVGTRASLVYNYTEKPSPNERNWLMTEYQINQNGLQLKPSTSEGMLLDKWVLCKIYRGKRSSSEKPRKERKVPVVTKIKRKLEYEEPSSLPAPVSQLNDQMMQSFQEACSLLNGEQHEDPQSSHDGQTNRILDLDHMSVDEVKRYFQEPQSASNGTLTSQTDPQSSNGGHITLNQDINDTRPNDMDFKPSTSDNMNTINNLQQDVVKAPEDQHHQQFLLAPPPSDVPFSYFDSALYYDGATKREIFSEPLVTNNPVYDLPFFDPELDFFATYMNSFQSDEASSSWSSFT